MEKYMKKFEPYMKEWLYAHFSPSEAQDRWKKAVDLDEKWIREEGTLGGRRNMMSSNLFEAYAFFAFYEATARLFTKEDLDALINNVMGKTFKFLSRFDMNKLEKKKWLMRLIYRYFGFYTKKADKHRNVDWGNTWKIRINPDMRDKGIAFAFDSCPLSEFADRHGYSDFLPNLCLIDQMTCRAMHAHLIRHKTIACGDGECSYWIIGDKDEEALSDVGSK